MNAKSVRESELADRITKILENKKDKIVFIRADREAKYSAVMAVMDELRAAKLE